MINGCVGLTVSECWQTFLYLLLYGLSPCQINDMFTNFPLDVAGNLDYKNLCYVITHGEDKEQE